MQFQHINDELTKHCDLINKRFEFGRGGGGGKPCRFEPLV